VSRILIVEDEVIIRAELRRLLTRKGHDVAEAGSVCEAERRHALGGFDLVLVDLRLPGAPGTDLIAKCAPTPVVVMTSYATPEAAAEAMKLGAAGSLSKPFNHHDLLQLVERTLARPRHLS
jgi:two-component system response regulator AtoC